MNAKRPNSSIEWDEKADTRAAKKMLKSFVSQFKEAVEKLATRK